MCPSKKPKELSKPAAAPPLAASVDKAATPVIGDMDADQLKLRASRKGRSKLKIDPISPAGGSGLSLNFGS